jgi:hypothetical protein
MPAVADYVAGIAEAELRFDGPAPLDHSRSNHEHLWMIEYAADHHGEIGLAFRCAAIRYILDRWRVRLKGYAPYRAQGYRLYVYADLAPTLSVVAETPAGCPYGNDLEFAPTIEAVVRPYAGQSWRARFASGGGIDPRRIIIELERHAGSLRGTASALRLPLAELRRCVEQWDIAADVNRIRKRHRRRPAVFTESWLRAPPLHAWEERLPAFYP